ncbi:hypothetical protein R70006_05795 [Paraburkholderia domus]|uniref:hypothetical protein n=1 Tax=Paraburkholderia domus TaxID=2793075 RepID=UPI0019138821|nr:hypothetical protein [Paraburkholderia domus]MBK5052541.1 hypothetical protein [Burkholderia sp. R-70006]CAE6811896.1 hypothetical protein R70006_05795 [Paraburkholderia domus]CAE6889037.1 hypothetical protein R75471_02266 [Paraburkholderia domus]
MPRQWESTAVVRIGQLFNGNSATLVEMPANVVARFDTRGFQNAALKRLGFNPDARADSRVKLLLKSARAKVVSSDLIEVDVNGFSPDEAQRDLRTLIDQLGEAHQAMMAPSLQRLNADLNEVNQLLADAQARSTRLTGEADRQLQAKGNGGSSPEGLILTELINDNAREISSIRQRKAEILEQLDPQRSFNTRPLEPIVVSDAPVSPKRAVMLFAGLIAGIGLVLCWALWRADGVAARS